MEVWALVEKHGYTLHLFKNHADAYLAKVWYREHYPNNWYSVILKKVEEKWEEN